MSDERPLTVGDVVEATEHWGVYVTKGTRGIVIRLDGHLLIRWNPRCTDEQSDVDCLTGPCGGFRLVSAVDRLGDVAG
ncbi:unnamed protein product [marine sediment metagenome]|uniref:Uncharacterized protein n=1 Tax=marine sediment metagenome TaxID=412755 RepID=X0TRJ8_9ZZZZ